MTLAAGATTTVESVSLTLSGSSFTGSGVMDVNGAACTLRSAGTYANNAISATYTGVAGCTLTGTWSLTQTCLGTPQSLDRRTQGRHPTLLKPSGLRERSLLVPVRALGA